MATKEQFEIFQDVYKDEQNRYSELINRGKIFLTIISVYLGVLALNLKDALNTELAQNGKESIFYSLAIGSFLIAFILNIVALGFFKYERLFNPISVLENIGEERKNNEDFFDERIVDYAVATDRNGRKNNLRAKILLIEMYFILIGIILHSIFYLTI